MPQVSLASLAEALHAGTHLASFPTDTVPALAAKLDRADLIFAAKQRSLDKPLILMAGEIEDLWSYVSGSNAERAIWQQVADHYWPGALTLVLPASDRIPPTMNPKDPTTIGVRVPNHAIARQVLSATGPLATTSANRSGMPTLLTLAEIEAEFPEVLTLAADELVSMRTSMEPIGSGLPSTVAKWTGDTWQILRQGAIALQ
jgi:L-threonylcarbamoyladenylate synthase